MQKQWTMKNIFIITILTIAAFSSKGQWTQTKGPNGGNINDILINGSNIFSATMGGGVFISANNGNTWDTLNTGLTTGFVYSLKFSNNKMFAGTHEGIFSSTNNGANWNPNFTGNPISSMAISDSIVLAGTFRNGVVFSIDSGITWISSGNMGLPSNNGWYFPIQSVAVIKEKWFVAESSGIYLSTNKGNTWTLINSGLTYTEVKTLAIIDTTIFAGTTGGVFVSSNNGNSWSSVNNGLTNLNILSLTVNSNKIFAGTDSGGVFVSSDYGLNWTPINNGLNNTLDIKSIAVHDSNIFVGTSHKGISVSQNYGANWTTCNNGVINHYVGSLITSNGKLFAGLTSGYYNTNGDGLLGHGDVGEGISISSDTSKTWTTMNGLLPHYKVNCFTVIDTNLFAGTDGYGVFISIDSGITWSAVNTGLSNLDVTSFAVIGNNLFAGAYGSVFLSTNFGASWTSVSTGLNPAYSIRSLAAKGADLYAGTNGQGIFKSINNGASWTLLNSFYGYVSAISMAVSGSNILAGSVFNGILLSEDDGLSWSPVYQGYIYSIAVKGNNVFAGTAGGVAVSSDNGLSWSSINNKGLSNLNILSVTTDDINLYAGTAGFGTFFTPITQAIQAGVNNLFPSKNFMQIFPNPFCTQTILQTDNYFKNASLTVHNSFGQTVKEIKNIYGHTITLYRDDLPNGIYFILMTQDEKIISTNKLIITNN